MSKECNPGELRTPVEIYRLEKKTDEEGYTWTDKENIFGDGKVIRVKWVNGHGSEVFAAMQLNLLETATITCRYSPKIQTDQVLYRRGEEKPWEIISIDNVEGRNKWLEIKIARRTQAR